MTRGNVERLRDAQDHVAHALSLLVDGLEHGGSRDRFQSFLYDLVVVGTIFGQVSGEAKGIAPHIPWHEVRATRNRIVHASWQVNATLLSVVTVDRLAALSDGLLDLISRLEDAVP